MNQILLSMMLVAARRPMSSGGWSDAPLKCEYELPLVGGKPTASERGPVCTHARARTTQGLRRCGAIFGQRSPENMFR